MYKNHNFFFSKENVYTYLITVHYASQLFAANKNKPAEVVNILVTNRSKLLRFFAGFKIDKGTILAWTLLRMLFLLTLLDLRFFIVNLI